MNARVVLVAGLIFAGYVAVRVVVIDRKATPRHDATPVETERAPDRGQIREAPRSMIRPVAEPLTPSESVSPIPIQPATTEFPSEPQRKQASSDPAQVPDFNDPAVKLRLGRLALNFAGTDSMADEIWALLINDPELSDNVRQDLIEDLNEEGFEDPRNLTEDDLPLIESRILLIEEHAPYAMDEVNADAFAEAYKDLVNMWLNVVQQ